MALIEKHFKNAENAKKMSRHTYFGSQWAIVKLKLIRVTNISVSKRISCTDGGGNAMANATIPSSGGCDFRVCENVYCGRSLHSIKTTWNENRTRKHESKTENKWLFSAEKSNETALTSPLKRNSYIGFSNFIFGYWSIKSVVFNISLFNFSFFFS